MSIPLGVERQGNNECMLATLAGIAGRPLAEVRKVACKHARTTTWNAAIQKHRAWSAVDATARHFGGEALAALLGPIGGGNMPGAVDLPAVGRGSVVFQMPGGRHICAWSDGFLYDSADDPKRPWLLSTYLAKHPKAWVLSIRTIEYDAMHDYDNPESPDLGY